MRLSRPEPVRILQCRAPDTGAVRLDRRRAGAGAAAGAIGGSTLGHGMGSAGAALGLALVGLAAGAIAEQALIDHPGVEYTVVLQSGQTYMLAQNLNPGDRILQPGERVMVQQGYGYMRVLPADNVPTDVERPPGLDVH